MQAPSGSPVYPFGLQLLTLSTFIFGYYANKGLGGIRRRLKVQNQKFSQNIHLFDNRVIFSHFVIIVNI